MSVLCARFSSLVFHKGGPSWFPSSLFCSPWGVPLAFLICAAPYHVHVHKHLGSNFAPPPWITLSGWFPNLPGRHYYLNTYNSLPTPPTNHLAYPTFSLSVQQIPQAHMLTIKFDCFLSQNLPHLLSPRLTSWVHTSLKATTVCLVIQIRNAGIALWVLPFPYHPHAVTHQHLVSLWSIECAPPPFNYCVCVVVLFEGLCI